MSSDNGWYRGAAVGESGIGAFGAGDTDASDAPSLIPVHTSVVRASINTDVYLRGSHTTGVSLDGESYLDDRIIGETDTDSYLHGSPDTESEVTGDIPLRVMYDRQNDVDHGDFLDPSVPDEGDAPPAPDTI